MFPLAGAPRLWPCSVSRICAGHLWHNFPISLPPWESGHYSSGLCALCHPPSTVIKVIYSHTHIHYVNTVTHLPCLFIWPVSSASITAVSLIAAIPSLTFCYESQIYLLQHVFKSCKIMNMFLFGHSNHFYFFYIIILFFFISIQSKNVMIKHDEVHSWTHFSQTQWLRLLQYGQHCSSKSYLRYPLT